MASTLHWELRKHLKDLRDDGRLAVLTALILHSNIRLRCWVSVDLLVAETGWSRPLVSKAKAWLHERGAFVLVPYRKRVDEELKLPTRQHVYQLTGMMDIDGKPIKYLFMNPEAEDAIKAVLSTLGHSKADERSLDERLHTERSLDERKVSTISKGNPISKGNTQREDTARARKAEPKIYDDVPKHERLLIIEAWAKNLSISPVNPAGQEKNHVLAADIYRDGYRAGQVALFVKAALNDKFWNGKTLTLQYVAQHMPAWLAAQPSTVITPPEPEPVTDAATQAMFRNAFRSKPQEAAHV